MRLLPIVLCSMLVTSSLVAEPVPGTSVDLKPPPGFVLADRFPGFMDEATGSSIMITEIPGPYGEVTAGFEDTSVLQARGMKVLDRSSIKVDGRAAKLFHVEQFAYSRLFKKWVLVVDCSGSTILVTGTYPSEAARDRELPLKTAVLSATFGKKTDPIEALPFTVTPESPFEIAEVMGHNLLLTPGGASPAEDESMPIMVVALSLSENRGVSDKRVFAESRVMQTATMKNITVQQSTPVKIGDLAGYTTVAVGEDEDTGTPQTIYQVILFDPAGYSLMQAVTPSTQSKQYLPLFEKMARSFELKKLQDKHASGAEKPDQARAADSTATDR